MLTASEIFEEYVKCIDDPAYAIETYLKTFDKTQEGFVPFKLFVRQRQIIRSYEKERFNLVTKPRQAGISTVTQAYLTIKIGFADPNNPETIIVIANKLNLAKKFLKGIKDYVNQLPRWVWGNEYFGSKEKEKVNIFVKDSQIEIELPNGSKVIAVATSVDALRGYTPTYLVFDEAAFIDKGSDLYAAAVTSLGTGGKCTLISCVSRDTFVFTDDGIKQVNDFIDDKKDGGYNVPHYNIVGNNKQRQSNIFFNNGNHETIKIKTSSSELEGTYTHKVWGYSFKHNKYDWYHMSDLTIGDYVNIQYGFELWGNDNKLNCDYKPKSKKGKVYTDIDEDLAYLIGLHISNNKIAQNTYYDISNEYFDKILLSLGFKLDNTDNYILANLLSLSRDNMVGLVQGIMDGNANIDTRLNKIIVDSNNELLLKQLRAILINFGILSEIKNDNELIISHSNINKYFDIIGFRFTSKLSKQKSLIQLNDITEFIPDGKKIIRNIIQEFSLTNRLRNTGLKVGDVKVNKINKTDDLNKTTFVNFINYFTNKLNLNLSNYNLDKILFNNSKWEKIKSLEYSRNDTYDFSLPNDDNDFWCHSIIYNGILGHQTPNGYDDLYYKTYEQAIRKDNSYNIIELKWYEDPRYNKDLKWLKGDEVVEEYEFTLDSFRKKVSEGYKPTSTWYENMCKSMNQDKKKIAQELDVSFLGSGGNVIDDEWISFHEKNNVREPKFIDKSYFDGNSGLTWIWSEPIEGHEYLLAADISRGDGSDFSSMQIIDFTTMEQVVEYQGKIPPDLFAELLDVYGRKYNAFLVVDNIGVGHTTTSRLEELKYPNLYYEEKTRGNKSAGFNINGVRLQLISHLEGMIRTNGIIIRSLRLIHEMKTFIYKNGRPDHMDGYFDDCLMALGMGLWVLQSSFKDLKKSNEQTKAMLSSWSTGGAEDKMSSTVEVYDPNKNKKVTKINPAHTAYRNVQDPNGDYLWLFSGLK